MNICIISYGIKEYDGRLIELRKMLDNLGTTYLICCSKDDSEFSVSDKEYLNAKTYIEFIKYAIKKTRNIQKIDILVADNFFAAIPVLIIKKILKIKFVIQDVRELYFINEAKGSSKIFCIAERFLMKRASIVLCANNYRADIMFERFSLKKKPLVFENIRFLEGTIDTKKLKEKYRREFLYDYNLVSTSGIFLSRCTDKLIESMQYVDDNVGLYIVGSSSEHDKKIAEKIIEENNIKNVKFLDKVPMDELKYIVQQCQIGIVHYHQNDYNNKYCASGKIYEFLNEGLPIVTTENPPLKKFCEEYSVGIADNSFSYGINTIIREYDKFKKNVEEYMKDISVDNYNQSIAEQVKRLVYSKEE